MQTKKRALSESEQWDLRDQIALHLDVTWLDENLERPSLREHSSPLMYLPTRAAAAFAQLSDRQKTVLAATMRGYNQRQIAEQMDISQQAVSRLLDRARAKFFDLLNIPVNDDGTAGIAR